MAYEYKIQKTYQHSGAPQNESHYIVNNPYFSARIVHYGNQGFDAPSISCKTKCNGYYWQLNTFMRAFYRNVLREDFFKLKLNETTVIKLEHYQY